MSTIETQTPPTPHVAPAEQRSARVFLTPTRAARFSTWRRARLAVPRATAAWVATGYLVAPVLLFLTAYLRAPLTGFCGVLLIAAIVWMRRTRRRGTGLGGTVALTRQGLAGLAASALAIAVSTGAIGGFRLMTDWYKHNAMLFDLSTNPWPVHYSYLGDASLIYSFAFYLPAAGASQLAGGSIAVAHTALVLWMAIGFFAVLLAAAAVLPARLRVVGALGSMLTYAGAESLGVWIMNRHSVTTPNPWWMDGVQYSGAWTAIRWVPQHAISGWLLGALFVLAWRDGTWRSVRWLTIALFASALWSPFVFIGGAVLSAFVLGRLILRQGLPPLAVWAPTAVAAVACSPVLAFLSLPAGEQKFEAGRLDPGQYALFVLLMVGLWAIAGFVASPLRLALLPAVGLLVLLPAFRLGMYNDLVMRVSMPALFVMCLIAWEGVLRTKRSGWRRVVSVGALAAAVLLAVPSNLVEMSYSVNEAVGVPGAVAEPRPLDQTLAQYLVMSSSGPGTLIWNQYITCSHGTLSSVLGLPDTPVCTKPVA